MNNIINAGYEIIKCYQYQCMENIKNLVRARVYCNWKGEKI